jgi:hypothetical protein
MPNGIKYRAESGAGMNAFNRRRRVAWILILIVDVSYIAWGAMAAASPDQLLGLGGKAILPAAYEGYPMAPGRSS